MSVGIHLFDRSTDRREYAPGEVVFSAGDPGDVMYAVIDGEVDIVVNGTVVEIAGPGSLIGEMGLIDKAPRSATARARTACTLAVVGERQFLFLVQEHPTFALTLMRLVADRLRRMDSAVAAPTP